MRLGEFGILDRRECDDKGRGWIGLIGVPGVDGQSSDRFSSQGWPGLPILNNSINDYSVLDDVFVVVVVVGVVLESSTTILRAFGR